VKKQSLRLPGGEISYLDTSVRSRETVVFIHGNSSDKHTFAGQLGASELSPWRCLALDLPGHGGSSKIDRSSGFRYSLSLYAETIAALLSELRIERAVLVGSSLGGHIAIRLTRLIKPAGLFIFQAPPLESASDLALAFLPHPAGQLFFSEHLTREHADAIAQASFLDASQIPSGFQEALLATDPKCRAETVADLMANPNYGEVTTVRGLSCPLAIVHGRQDLLVNAEYIEKLKLANLWRGGVQYMDGGHFPHIVNSKAFNTCLRDFLKETLG
jgi:pimeloyl-ACP methyl ester carboxylesterase